LKVYQHIDEFDSSKKTVITTGTFDGVHIGHQKILKRLVSLAKEKSLESVLLTFHPHPRIVLQKSSDLKLIQSQEEKIKALKLLGIDHLIIHPFTKEFAKTSSVEFIREILKKKLGAHCLAIGYDHQFGKNREGSFEHLKEYSSLYGFDVEEIAVEDVENIAVSSTKIRKALNKGDIETAGKFLTRPFSLSGKVVDGEKIGRTIGFPTANIMVEDPHKIIPKNGVYYVSVLLNGEKHFGMLNIGIRPTIDKSDKQSIEVHIFDFKENIYQQEIQINFLKFIREEISFQSKEDLSNQLTKDKNVCLSFQ
jgi:riboflavin kinase/FMN adenylyltransferase